MSTTTPPPTHDHDPDGRLDYPINWADWLPSGETISASTWLADDPLILEDDAHTDTATVVVIKLAPEAVVGQKYRVTNHIVTSPGGLEEDQSFFVKVKEK